MSALTAPHGGELKPRLLGGDEKRAAIEKSHSLRRVPMTSREVSDLLMLGMGAFSPVMGFMGPDDYEEVVRTMRLSSGILWPIPITLSASDQVAGSVRPGEEVALVEEETGVCLGIMKLQEKFRYDKEREAREIFRTDDGNHPGVAKLYAQGEWYLAGPVSVLDEAGYPQRFPEYARPAQTRQLFQDRGWKTVAGFQTRNPIHRSHEYCTKIALELCDGLFIHPIVGKLKAGDIPAEVRMRCYNVLLDHYYPLERVVLRVYPMEMRYAGPREAVLHAIFRQNFGCSHLIIGRDHAGVGNYYGPFDAQQIFDTIDPEDLIIRPLKIDWTFWCRRCEGMASTKTCPHKPEDRVIISGTGLREMLQAGQMPAAEFSRPEVLKILMEYYRTKNAN
ncbi:MAG: sulfate adenylyltransferase [Deltaproteobacteria bacterium]|nr:sulfate adenylyltransferase [Deltaproteobacteria bacterium]